MFPSSTLKQGPDVENINQKDINVYMYSVEK